MSSDSSPISVSSPVTASTERRLRPLPNLTSMAPVRNVPLIPWERLLARLRRDWKPGEHVTIIGPTRSGKTHLAIELLELCRYRLVLATKRRDPLVQQLQRDGYQITGDISEIQWDGERRVPLNPKVVYWPQFPEKMDAVQRRLTQTQLMRKALDWADKTGGWAVLLDETMWMSDTLKLEQELKNLWFQGRTQGLSVIACAQRPTHVPRLAFSSADYLFLARTSDKRDVENLREISAGIPKEMIETAMYSLDFDRHEFLFIDTHSRELAKVVAPPR